MAWTPDQLVKFSDAGDCYAEWSFLPGEDEGSCRMLLGCDLEGMEPLEAAQTIFARAQAWANAMESVVVLQTYGNQRHGVRTFVPEPSPWGWDPSEWRDKHGKERCAHCNNYSEEVVVATSVYTRYDGRVIWQTTLYPACDTHKQKVQETVKSSWTVPFDPKEGVSFTTQSNGFFAEAAPNTVK